MTVLYRRKVYGIRHLRTAIRKCTRDRRCSTPAGSTTQKGSSGCIKRELQNIRSSFSGRSNRSGWQSAAHLATILRMPYAAAPAGVISGMTDGVFRSCSIRSEEHTSELQSRGHLVCRLLLEQKK